MWVILFGGFLSFLLHHLLTNWELYRLSWHMPGPFMIPLIGTLRTSLGVSHEGSMIFLKNITENFKTPARWWIGTKMYVVVKTPEDMQTVLNSPNCINHAEFYKYLKCLGGDGLVTLPASEWKVHRKLLNPTFSLKILQTYMPIFNKESKILVSRIQELCNKATPTDICNYMNAMSLDIICQTTMGTEMHIQNNQNTEYIDSENNLLSITSKRMFSPLLQINWIFCLMKLDKIEKKCSNIVFEFVNKILQKKKSNFKYSNETETALDDDLQLKSPQIFIDQLMSLLMIDKKFSDHDVLSEANTIVVTGFETTALISSYCILMLAIFQEHQAKLYDEIKSIMPNKEDDVKYEDFSKYDFLDRFIKETLRLFPAVPMIARTVDESFKLGNYTIPQGANIIGSIIQLHRDEKTWGPNAEKFDPDNFLSENFAKIHPFGYLPFSGGPRNCLGIKYAFMVIKTIIIHLVSNYKFHTDLKMSELRYRMDITLKLINKHMVYVEKRN